MKKGVSTLTTFLLLALLSACAGTFPIAIGGGSRKMDLDAAIRAAAAQMEENLPRQTTVALVSVASSSVQLSEYVINRLEASLVGGRRLVVVDRANLDRIREEQGFQLSGEVSDESAKTIGRLLGAGAIVTGSFTDLGDVYSLTLKAINMETAAVAVSFPADIAKSTRIRTMLATGGGAATSGGAYGGVATSGGGTQTVQGRNPPPPVPPGPEDGTYTFWPRVQAFQGARAVHVYLDRIVVRRGYMTIYIYATSRGDGGYTERLSGSWEGATLKNMENNRLARFVEAVHKAGAVYGAVTMCDLSFQNVTGTRLTLASADSPPIEFYDIVLEHPDN